MGEYDKQNEYNSQEWLLGLVTAAQPETIP